MTGTDTTTDTTVYQMNPTQHLNNSGGVYFTNLTNTTVPNAATIRNVPEYRVPEVTYEYSGNSTDQLKETTTPTTGITTNTRTSPTTTTKTTHSTTTGCYVKSNSLPVHPIEDRSRHLEDKTSLTELPSQRNITYLTTTTTATKVSRHLGYLK